MARTSLEKIEELEAARLRIAARLNAEKAKLRNGERKLENRRKIIVGAVVREHARLHPDFAETLDKILASHVLRPADRALLGLPPIPDT